MGFTGQADKYSLEPGFKKIGTVRPMTAWRSRKDFRTLRTLCNDVIGFNELADRPEIDAAKRIAYEARVYGGGVALAIQLAELMEFIEQDEQTETNQFHKAIGQVAAEFDHRARTLLTNICALAELMAAPANSMTREEKRVAAETVLACAERLTIETAHFTSMISPLPR